MAKTPNFFAMTLPELMEWEANEREENEKLLKKQKKLKKSCERLGKAEKAATVVRDQTGQRGIIRGLIAKLKKGSAT